jgi:hypothetical protein
VEGKGKGKGKGLIECVEINTELHTSGTYLDFLPQPKVVVGNKYWEGGDGKTEPVRARYGNAFISLCRVSLMTSRL